MANDLGGKAKKLFSIDDGNGNAVNPTDLLNADGLVNGISAWELTGAGNYIRINNGKLELMLAGSLSGLGATSVNALGAGDHIHDEFVYAIRLGNGTLSWAHVTFDLQGENDAATISVTAGGDYDVTEAGGVANGTADDPNASGDLDVSDVDAGEAKFQAPAGLEGTSATSRSMRTRGRGPTRSTMRIAIRSC
jgi:VCBS repeat-containing protein